ncbi:MAG: UpxY family transcription antiterminator [Ignavibacteriales bacterium]|jgi:transcription antitermination factor NusG|nr:MAG: UpxY family transcription antiterminator [Ignavibacteriales bacterium]
MGINNSRSWFALVVKSKCEFKAEEELNTLGVQSYLPISIAVRKWSDRKKEIKVPLIKGYIFISATEKERLYSLEQKSIVKCLFSGGKPAIIPDWQIENLKKILKYKSEVIVENYLAVGDSVKIIEGPFEGVVGILKSSGKERTLSVSIDLIHRSVVVHLSSKSIVKALD